MSSNKTLNAGLLLRLAFKESSRFQSLTTSSIDIRRGLVGRLRNWFFFGRGISVIARRAATAGGSAFGSCADTLLPPMVGTLLVRIGVLVGPADCVRSGIEGAGTDRGCVGTRTGSVVVRAGDIGLSADFLSLLGEVLLPTRLFPFFSSKTLSLGGEELYLNDRGTNIFAQTKFRTKSPVKQWDQFVKDTKMRC